jgi:hypothetical protein
MNISILRWQSTLNPSDCNRARFNSDLNRHCSFNPRSCDLLAKSNSLVARHLHSNSAYYRDGAPLRLVFPLPAAAPQALDEWLRVLFRP